MFLFRLKFVETCCFDRQSELQSQWLMIYLFMICLLFPFVFQLQGNTASIRCHGLSKFESGQLLEMLAQVIVTMRRGSYFFSVILAVVCQFISFGITIHQQGVSALAGVPCLLSFRQYAQARRIVEATGIRIHFMLIFLSHS